MIVIYRIERGVITLFSSFWNRVKMKLYGIEYGKSFISCGSIIYRNYGGQMKIGDKVCINSQIIADPIGGQSRTILVVGKTGKLIIGNNVGISNTVVFASDEIIIEDEAVIGAGCKIYDTDFHSIFAEYRLKGNTNVKTASVRIGKRSFIGGHSIILKGVTIGECSVVAAGSVVTKDVPDFEVWGGNPAMFIKSVNQ